MPSMLWHVLPLFGVQRLKRHADLQLAVPGVRVRRAVLRILQLHLGRVARQLAQRLRNSQLDLRLARIGQGV